MPSRMRLAYHIRDALLLALGAASIVDAVSLGGAFLWFVPFALIGMGMIVWGRMPEWRKIHQQSGSLQVATPHSPGHVRDGFLPKLRSGFQRALNDSGVRRRLILFLALLSVINLIWGVQDGGYFFWVGVVGFVTSVIAIARYLLTGKM